MNPKIGSPRVWAPIAILLGGFLVAAVVVATRPELEPEKRAQPAPLVEVVEASLGPVRFHVYGNGVVVPRSEGDLVPQVSGEVVWVSPDLVAGGFFEEGEPLLRIERADYEAALEEARAMLARARSEFARAEKELARQRRLADRSVAAESRIDDAENAHAVAQATLREAQARLTRAQRDLERTELQAPYEGRVRSESVDVGQFVARGQTIARLYAVDFAEVRLPLPDRELRFLDLSLRPTRTPTPDPEAAGAPPPADAPGNTPEVTLRAEFAGRSHAWQGRIVRTEGEIDPRSRMVNVIARVPDPYGRRSEESMAPLAVGLFVEAEIEGRSVDRAIVLPRTALRRAEQGEDHVVWVVDGDGRLTFRDVDVLRVERDRVVLGGGLLPGEEVVVSPLRGVVDGMAVRVHRAQAPVARLDATPGEDP
ncbi:MAG: efflux RND transporter periplasmic adaptor subunit [Myxococcota bacterium]